ncbi:MAG: sugar transferase [Parachlamydiaceae bacterium]|nr:sugar transferase [Parachlamydiaceae bacterium]
MNTSDHWQQTTFDLNLFPSCYKIQHIFFKRLFDFLFSLIVITLGLPLFILIGIAIRCTSKGPIFYFQERIGRGGIPFRCFKFRTMFSDADQRLQAILACDATKQNEWQKNHKLKNDPRITPIGNFLRKTSLDELPQFWNVIKGDLSVVGPRPVVHEEIIRHYGPKAYKILTIRPGLTGIWQVSGRSNTGYEKRILLDEQYVDTRSFGLDVKLIAKTIPSMISAKGAY